LKTALINAGFTRKQNVDRERGKEKMELKILEGK
jgi:hypothetical protein